MTPSAKSLYWRLLQNILPYKPRLALGILAMILTAAMEPMFPMLMQPLVDGSLIAKDADLLFQVPLLIMLVFLLKGVGEYFAVYFNEWVAQRAVLNLRQQLYERILSLPQGRIQQITYGRLISKVTYDVPNVASSLSEAWLVLIRDSLMILGLLAYLIYTSWQMTLVLLIIGPAISWIVKKASVLLRKSAKGMQQSMGDLTHVLEEGIKGNREIKAYGAQAYEQQRFARAAESMWRQTLANVRVSAANVPMVQFFGALAIAAVLYFASSLVMSGELTPGTFMGYITAMGLLFEPVRRLTRVNTQLQQGLAAAQSIFEMLDEATEVDEGQHKLPPNIAGDVQLQGVSFRYADTTPWALQDIHLHIHAGQTTALVGLSGSGKSTLANLIPRFYQWQQGQILLDGVDITQYAKAELRQAIAFVGQEVILFNDTFAANIAYGQANADPQRLEAAAKAANAWEFIQQHPLGLYASVGEAGTQLSGGQRQRIALARAFYKDAPILILDEATSALDNESETKVQEALERLEQGRTTLIIAHRLSTIEKADQIVVMGQGRVLEQGTHQQLLAQGQVYARLYQQGFAESARE